MRVLVADIGATNARLAVVVVEAGELHFESEAEYASAHHDGLEPILRDFVSGLKTRPERACIGVPGPVVDGAARLPILGWEVRTEEVARAAGVPEPILLNDFEVLARSIPFLGDEDFETLQPGRPPADAREPHTLAVVGAGTGLGHAYLTSGPDGYRVHPSEGGHAEFSPRSPLEWELREHLAARFGRVSVERVVSGPGLLNVYRFLVDTGRVAEAPGVRERMAEVDPAAVIAERGMEGSDEASATALALLVDAYGAHAGDVALVLRAEGGVFLGGGIPPRILPRLRDGAFLEAFLDKGRLRPLLERVPVHVILNSRAALVGAARVAWSANPRTPGQRTRPRPESGA